MLKIFVAIVSTILGVVFFMANTHPVAVSFVFGPPVPIRLIFLLLTAYGLGVLTVMFINLLSSFRAYQRKKHTVMPTVASSPRKDLLT